MSIKAREPVIALTPPSPSRARELTSIAIPTLGSLEQKLVNLTIARKQLSVLAGIHRRLYGQLQHSAQFKEIEEAGSRVDQAQFLVTSIEQELRASTLAYYNATLVKKPVGGLEVKMFKSLSYDQPELIAWCQTYSPALLAFSLVPGALKALVNLPGAPVTTLAEPRVLIASDLTPFCSLPDLDSQRPLTVTEAS